MNLSRWNLLLNYFGFVVCCPGLGKTILPRMEGLVKSAGLLYFRVFKHQTVDYFNSSISVFWNTPVMAPALFFYSENDALCDYKSLEKMVEFWRSRGQTVESKMWKESVHAGHLRTHPQDYLSTLEYFVQSLNMVPLKAKMWILMRPSPVSLNIQVAWSAWFYCYIDILMLFVQVVLWSCKIWLFLKLLHSGEIFMWLDVILFNQKFIPSPEKESELFLKTVALAC